MVSCGECWVNFFTWEKWQVTHNQTFRLMYISICVLNCVDDRERTTIIIDLTVSITHANKTIWLTLSVNDRGSFFFISFFFVYYFTSYLISVYRTTLSFYLTSQLLDLLVLSLQIGSWPPQTDGLCHIKVANSIFRISLIRSISTRVINIKAIYKMMEKISANEVIIFTWEWMID